MARDVARDWMWSEALEMLARAERLHRGLFKPVGSKAHQQSWEPPVDILETEFEVLALVALPGVDPDSVEAVIDDGDLVIGGARTYPLRSAPPSFIASSCRRAVSTGGCVCRPAVTTACAVRWSMDVW